MFYELGGNDPNYGSDFMDLGLETSVDLGEKFPGVEYHIMLAVAAMDAAGNMADLGGHASALLDFIPPNPVGAGSIG